MAGNGRGRRDTRRSVPRNRENHIPAVTMGAGCDTTFHACIRVLAPASGVAQPMLSEASQDDERLSRGPFGFVPFRCLVKRPKRARTGLLHRPQKLAALLAGRGLT